jgi:hypothetical protein
VEEVEEADVESESADESTTPSVDVSRETVA